MEIINESKSNSNSIYDKVSIMSLLEFIKVNLSQMKNINMVEPNIDIQTKTKPLSKTLSKSQPKIQPIQTFYEKLSSFCYEEIITFDPDFLNTFSFHKTKLNLRIINLKLNSEEDVGDTPPLSNTFFKSILFCLNTLTNDLVKKLIEFMAIDIQNEGFKEHSYSKLKLNKNTIYKDILANNITKDVIRFAGDYLHINIFYFDELSKTFCYEGGEYIPFKKNIILYKYNSEFYPVFTPNSQFFNFKDEPIKSFLINSNEITANNFTIGSADLSKYIKNVKNFDSIVLQSVKSDKVDTPTPTSDKESTITEITEHNTINKFDESYTDEQSMESKYLSMSLKEIQKVATSANINTKSNGKLKNKKELIQEILKK